jgi:arylsulfatase A-like enzyme
MAPPRSALPALAAVGLLAWAACSDSRPPNVVVIGLEGVRFDTFWLPERKQRYDGFSAWAPRAVRFPRTLAAAPWTPPSLASVMTGRHPAAADVGVDGVGTDSTTRGGLGARETLPELLAEHGYRTGGVLTNGGLGGVAGLDGVGFRLYESAPAPLVVPIVHEWIERARDDPRPFFLYVHLSDASLRPPGEGGRGARAKADALPGRLRRAALADAVPGRCDAEGTRTCLSYLAYASDVLHQRQAVAEILRGLRERALLERTIVVLYSDHGTELGERTAGAWGDGHSLYQEQIHVPLLVWHPSLFGREAEVGVSLVDLAPTLLEWAGAEPLERCDGASFAQLDSFTERPRFAGAPAAGRHRSAVALGPWKLIRRAGSEPDLLFDLEVDPGERTPVDDAERSAGLGQLLARHRGEAPAP